MQEQLVKESVGDDGPPPEGGRGAQLAVILKFFSIWLSSLAILVAIALLSNIEWARRHIESAICESFHRQVRLGRLSWSFGLQGLAIDTDRFVMQENDGSPFVSSGPSEIGFAFLPLFQKRLVIKHLQFDHPEVWAVKLDKNRWNFSDLLTAGPEIHMVQIEKGKLHLRNQESARGQDADKSDESAWKSYDLNDIKLSLTLPNRDRNWPLFLSCKIPIEGRTNGQNYETSVRVSATGKGAFKDWQKNKYSVDLQLQNFDSSRFRPLISRLPQIQGLCNLNVRGDGTFDKGFYAVADASIINLKMPAAKDKTLELARAGFSTKLLIDPNTLQWNELKLSLLDWKLESRGQLSNWQKSDPSYDASVDGNLSDLKEFFDKVLSCYLPDQAQAAHKKFRDSKLEKISKAQAAGELPGTATIQLLLKGDSQQQTVSTDIKADGIPLAQLIDDELGSSFVEAFKLDPDAPIKGELNITPGKRLEVKDLEIPLEDSKVKLTGFIDQQTGETEFDFDAANLSFDTFKKRLGSENSIVNSICQSNGKNKAYSISGILDIKGHYQTDGKKPQVFIDSTLKGLRLTRQDSTTPTCSNIKGRIIYENDRVQIKQLCGTLAGSNGVPGDFAISGHTNLQNANHSELDLKAREVSIAQLKDWVTRFGVKLQGSGLEKLSGDLHELKAHVMSQNNKASTNITVVPADLQISDIAGKSGPDSIKLSSGVITLDNDELSANDVVISTRGGKLTVSGTMKGELESMKLVSARLRTDGFELADMHSVLKSLAQGRAKNALPDFMTPSQSGAALHGRIYGDILMGSQGSTDAISGVVGFQNAGGRFGKEQLLLDKVTGVVVLTKDQLVFQETSGQLGKSSFAIDGVLSNYASSAYNWQGQLKGQFYPEEVDRLMDNLGHGIALASRGNEPLNLRVTGSGDKNAITCMFRGKASPSYGISLKTAFGTFHQPKGRPLTFHGGLNLNSSESQLTLNNFQMNSGSEKLQAKGDFKWANESAEKPAALSFALSTPTPVKTATLLEISSQTTEASPMQISGTSQLNMKVEGPVTDLVLTGTIALEKNSLPSVHLDNLSGKLDLPGWHLNKAGPTESGTSVAKLELNTLAMGGLALHNAGATLSLDGDGKITFKDFQATLSGGKLNISGFYSPQKQSYHADINVTKLVVDEFVKDLIDHSGGVSGLADVSMSLDNMDGIDSPRSLTGAGQFSIYQGSVASFGKLQEKLNESNLLQQGIFGFNVNNLLQAMMPVKSGQFNDISGKFKIGKGNVNFDQLRFEGNNLRMRAAGKFDFIKQNVDINVAGDIPRVSSSIIPGAIGEMSRKVTLQRMFSIVTFRKLKDLPALPLLGDIANDDPRAFVFSVDTPTEPPKLITQAVEKSFKWLPNKPFASAHPVPGI